MFIDSIMLDDLMTALRVWVQDDTQLTYSIMLNNRRLTLTKELDGAVVVVQELKCPDCDGEMVARKSQYGNFWGCKKYPKCKGTRDTMGRSKEEARAERDKEETEKAIKNGTDNVMDGVRYKFNKE